MNALYNIGSGHPKCLIKLKNKCRFIQNEQPINGIVEITALQEGQVIQHDGIKITLIGIIENKNQGMLSSNQNYAFLQLSRELEFQGSFNTAIVRDFQFNKPDLQHDSYDGIGLKLRYYLKVEMTYQGSLMKSTLTEELDLNVRNHSQNSQQIEVVNLQDSQQQVQNLTVDLYPQIKNELVPFNYQSLPLLIDLTLTKARLNIDTDCLEGTLKFREVNHLTQLKVLGVNIELIQQEIQVSTNSQQYNQRIQLDQLKECGNNSQGVNNLYQLRTLKTFEAVDGCPPNNETIAFTIPLRGIPKITPTLKNVYNKFSAKYYIKCVIDEIDEDDQEKDIKVCSNLYEITLYK
eukprot:403367452